MSLNQEHKINVDPAEESDTVQPSHVTCSCGTLDAPIFPQFVHAIVQRHAQMVAGDYTLEIAREF